MATMLRIAEKVCDSYYPLYLIKAKVLLILRTTLREGLAIKDLRCAKPKKDRTLSLSRGTVFSHLVKE